jgi:hypothetical protein
MTVYPAQAGEIRKITLNTNIPLKQNFLIANLLCPNG